MRSRHSYAGICRTRHRPRSRGVTTTLAGRFEHYLRLRLTLERQVRRALGARPRLRACAARSRTASARRRCTSNSSPPPRPISSRRAGRHQHGGGQQPGRPGARLEAAEAGEVGQFELRRDRQPGARPDPHRRLSTRSRSRTGSSSPRISARPASGTASRQNVRAVNRAILDANGFPSIGAARFFINGLDTTTKGIDIVGTYRFGAGDLGRWTLTAAYNHNKTKIDKRLNALGPLAPIPGLVLFGRVEGIRFTEGQPRDKIVLSADGDIGEFGADRAHHPLRQGASRRRRQLRWRRTGRA